MQRPTLSQRTRKDGAPSGFEEIKSGPPARKSSLVLDGFVVPTALPTPTRLLFLLLLRVQIEAPEWQPEVARKSGFRCPDSQNLPSARTSRLCPDPDSSLGDRELQCRSPLV